MERKGRFTRGPAEVSQTEPDAKVKTRAGYINVGDTLYHKENIANASLIASAFNAATTCEDMGYDGEACVKALPELVESLTECIGPELSGESNEFCKGYETVAIRMTWGKLRRARAILAECRG